MNFSLKLKETFFFSFMKMRAKIFVIPLIVTLASLSTACKSTTTLKNRPIAHYLDIGVEQLEDSCPALQNVSQDQIAPGDSRLNLLMSVSYKSFTHRLVDRVENAHSTRYYISTPEDPQLTVLGITYKDKASADEAARVLFLFWGFNDDHHVMQVDKSVVWIRRDPIVSEGCLKRLINLYWERGLETVKADVKRDKGEKSAEKEKSQNKD